MAPNRIILPDLLVLTLNVQRPHYFDYNQSLQILVGNILPLDVDFIVEGAKRSII